MIRTTALATVATLMVATPALASHCPKDAKAIDHGLSVIKVSDTVKSEVKALRDKGMAAHKAGKHRDAEAALAEGMRKLLNAAK